MTGDRHVVAHGVPRLLVAAAVAVVTTHWLRLLPLGYAAPGATRYEDFVDLLTPYVVAGPLLLVLARVGVGGRAWAVAAVGTVAFTQGHGLHLAANSISHARGPQPPAYLWDEVVGHHLWFAGLALLLAVVASATAGLDVGVGALGVALSALVGLTLAANVVEGGAVPLGAVLVVGLTAAGWPTRRRPVTALLLLSLAVAVVLTVAYGLWQGGFPQPSELGWL